jgi:hypothetical protein
MQTRLKLHLEDLAVDSFDTIRPARKGGTVFGEQCTCGTLCTCPGQNTCDVSCEGTCEGEGCGTGVNTCFAWSCDACNTNGPCTTAQYTYCYGQPCCPI